MCSGHKKAHVHDKRDNVAVALEDLSPGDVVRIEDKEIEVSQKIPFGHKIAIEDINEGEKVIKYGEVIGVAKEPIKAGEHVHVHNLKSLKYS